MTDYVVGFAFSAYLDSVVLVEKTHPEWQAGLLNGPGGKVDTGETPAASMAREFEEECGVATAASEWELIAVLSFPVGRVSFFRTFLVEAFLHARSMTPETVRRVPVDRLFDEKCVDNIRYLVPLCLFAESSASGSKLRLPLEIVEEAV